MSGFESDQGQLEFRNRLGAEVMAGERLSQAVIGKELGGLGAGKLVYRVGDKSYGKAKGLLPRVIKGCWGWLGAEAMGEAGDRWSIATPYSDWPDWQWAEVWLPRAWDGHINRWLADDFLHAGTLVGSFYYSDPKSYKAQEGYWVSSCRWTGIPDWPKLEEGTPGSGWANEMERLGVMRLEPSKSNLEKGQLLVAWGDGAGGFLGWEKVTSAWQAREGDPFRRVELVGMENWEKLEGQLRNLSKGREL